MSPKFINTLKKKKEKLSSDSLPLDLEYIDRQIMFERVANTCILLPSKILDAFRFTHNLVTRNILYGQRLKKIKLLRKGIKYFFKGKNKKIGYIRCCKIPEFKRL